MDAMDHIRRAIGPLERRLRSLLMRATLTAVDDTGDLQALQVTRLAGETIDDCERVGQYGLASYPPIGAEVLIGQVGSNGDHQVVLGVDDRSRPHPLTAGQTVIYDAGGTTIKLDGAGNLVITTPGNVTVNSVGNVEVNSSGAAVVSAASIALEGPTEVIGTLSVTGNVVIGGTLNGHAP